MKAKSGWKAVLLASTSPMNSCRAPAGVSNAVLGGLQLVSSVDAADVDLILIDEGHWSNGGKPEMLEGDRGKM